MLSRELSILLTLPVTYTLEKLTLDPKLDPGRLLWTPYGVAEGGNSKDRAESETPQLGRLLYKGVDNTSEFEGRLLDSVKTAVSIR